MNQSPQHIHFLGVAGIGVSALAQVAQARRIRVSGSDLHANPDENPAIARLLAGGATIYQTHDAGNLADDVDLVVATAAVSEENPEIAEARRRDIRVVSRAEFLGELMAAHLGPKIAVAGTHGKTTTTAMLGVLLQEAGLNPTVFVGGEVAQLGGNVRIGSPTGPFVAEACEAYDSFLHLKPDIAVITNIEADHLDHYGSERGVYDGFYKFLRGLPPDAVIVPCLDSLGVWQALKLFPAAEFPGVFGFAIEDDRPESKAENLNLHRKTAFDWRIYGQSVPITLGVPGRHNVMNALAAATAARKLDRFDLSPTLKAIAAGLGAFCGTERRQDILGEANGILVMDDYAHHPTEIRATLDAMRNAYPTRRIVAIFQPHLYSRTRDFLDAFAFELAKSDLLIVTDIYKARETPIAGVDAADIVTLAKRNNRDLQARYVANRRDIPADACRARPARRQSTLILFMGAGDINEQGAAVCASDKRKRTRRDIAMSNMTFPPISKTARRCPDGRHVAASVRYRFPPAK